MEIVAACCCGDFDITKIVAEIEKRDASKNEKTRLVRISTCHEEIMMWKENGNYERISLDELGGMKK